MGTNRSLLYDLVFYLFKNKGMFFANKLNLISFFQEILIADIY